MMRRTPNSRIKFALHEPSVITAAQVVTNLIAGTAGTLTLLGTMPILVTNQVGATMGIAIGGTLVFGGLLGTFAVLFGQWWLERIALLFTGLGWALLLPASITFALHGGSPVRWLIVLMLLTAIGDVFKRYRRIDWAYLDPTK